MEKESRTAQQKIEVIYQAECLSLSGRSKLTYLIGKDDEQGVLHMSIADNSGSGMWCRDWASAESIDAILNGGGGLTAKSFQTLHPGKSINTGGFILAALRDLGLLRVCAENTRVHRHIAEATFKDAVEARLALMEPHPAQDDIPVKKRRKAQEVA